MAIETTDLVDTGAPHLRDVSVAASGDENATLRRQLETERSAGRALLSVVAELEARVKAHEDADVRVRHEKTVCAARIIELETALAEQAGRSALQRLLNR